MVPIEEERLSIITTECPNAGEALERLLLASREVLPLQGLDGVEREALAALHGAAACRDGQEVTLFSAPAAEGVIAGAACLRIMGWDTDLLRQRVASIELFAVHSSLSANDAGRHYRELLDVLLAWCRNQRIDLVVFRPSARNADLRAALARLGSEPLSAMVNMYRPFGDGDWPQIRGIEVRPAAPSDHAAVEQIMVAGYRNRLLKDPLVDPVRARELYRAWIRNDLSGRVEQVLVADVDGVVSGFVAHDRKKIGGRQLGFIDMIVVDPENRGGGVGSALMYAAMAAQRASATGCYLGVEDEPDGPVAFYRRLGFVPFDTLLCYHLRP